ncbi:hypothetical protein HYH03_002766 [Edaphochlamys debaryana]|uniref:Uncharacterized protein n=1 Tax=Edaphochlamys debaryana TaxID=47281 RepID=A0A835YA57_9CHLO|nr:hypothetical protein HYH03_002766 [Edaphochlamys debaryana]|eukprot:KAG2499185.1 hypothetical protein HYH03_002766 [Edaphochlamys debaryana]
MQPDTADPFSTDSQPHPQPQPSAPQEALPLALQGAGSTPANATVPEHPTVPNSVPHAAELAAAVRERVQEARQPVREAVKEGRTSDA